MMHYRIIISEKAENDIGLAMEYYNQQQLGLGKRFLSEVNHTISDIHKSPFYQIRYDDVRCLKVKKFPFMIHFRFHERENKIMVEAVVHTSLNPDDNWIE